MNHLKATHEDVRYAYRLLLGREPDQEGFENLVAYIKMSSATAIDIADGIMRSPEFALRSDGIVGLQELELLGVKIFPWQGDRLIGDNLVINAEYEPHVLPEFLRSINPGDFVLDVGANIGIYSLLAARKTGESGKVFSVEPIAKNVQSLCVGILANGFKNISVLPVAASDRASVIGVLRHVDSSNGIVDAAVNGSALADYVPTQRLDELLPSLSRLDVIKIDIEGHEPVAWHGIKALVDKFRPIIFSEFNPVAIRNHARVPPETYLEDLFRFADGEITVLHLNSQSKSCRSSDAVMGEWRRANDSAGLNGSMHLDLKFNTRN